MPCERTWIPAAYINKFTVLCERAACMANITAALLSHALQFRILDNDLKFYVTVNGDLRIQFSDEQTASKIPHMRPCKRYNFQITLIALEPSSIFGFVVKYSTPITWTWNSISVAILHLLRFSILYLHVQCTVYVNNLHWPAVMSADYSAIQGSLTRSSNEARRAARQCDCNLHPAMSNASGTNLFLFSKLKEK